MITMRGPSPAWREQGSFWQRRIHSYKPKPLRADGGLLLFFPLHQSGKQGSVMFNNSKLGLKGAGKRAVVGMSVGNRQETETTQSNWSRESDTQDG